MSMDIRRAVVIVDPGLALGLLANTVATIGTGLGAAVPALGGTAMTDAVGRSIHNSANRPIPILQASPAALCDLLLKTFPAPEDAVVVVFPQFARNLHAFEDYQAQFRTCDLAHEIIEGVGIVGPPQWVTSLTRSMKQLRC